MNETNGNIVTRDVKRLSKFKHHCYKMWRSENVVFWNSGGWSLFFLQWINRKLIANPRSSSVVKQKLFHGAAIHWIKLTCCVDASGRHGAFERGNHGSLLRLQLCHRLWFDWCSRGRRFGERRWENVLAILSEAKTYFFFQFIREKRVFFSFSPLNNETKPKNSQHNQFDGPNVFTRIQHEV